MSKRSRRTDEYGRAFAGSQLQIQIYVNRRPVELGNGCVAALPSLDSLNPKLSWVSPLEHEKFVEYQDTAFLRALGMEHLAGKLRDFWPTGGPVWDALATVKPEDCSIPDGVLLVEAKSYPGEVYGNGCQASSSRSLGKIKAALDRTKAWLGVDSRADWTGPLYQSANRLAHLYFFREIAGVPAWLANIYFVNDPHSPTGHPEWQLSLDTVKCELGLEGAQVPHAADVFLLARDRSELA